MAGPGWNKTGQLATSRPALQVLLHPALETSSNSRRWLQAADSRLRALLAAEACHGLYWHVCAWQRKAGRASLEPIQFPRRADGAARYRQESRMRGRAWQQQDRCL